MAQDDYYYEIQLTNKQLVFYFIAGAAGLVLAFLAGVMVGRGLDDGPAQEATRTVVEERVVPEQSPTPAPTEYSYPQRLDGERVAETLERVPATPAAAPSTSKAATPQPVPVQAARPPAAAATVAAAPPAAAPPAAAVAVPAAGATEPSRPGPLPRAIGSNAAVRGFAVQVGSFKDRASAEVVVKRLRGRGFPAFSVAPAGQRGGFFPVRVGVYRDRADAKAVEERLRDDKFQPIIIKQ